MSVHLVNGHSCYQVSISISSDVWTNQKFQEFLSRSKVIIEYDYDICFYFDNVSNELLIEPFASQNVAEEYENAFTKEITKYTK